VGDGASAALKAELAEAKASCSELQQRFTEVQLELEQTSHALRSIKEVVSVADTEKSQVSTLMVRLFSLNRTNIPRSSRKRTRTCKPNMTKRRRKSAQSRISWTSGCESWRSLSRLSQRHQ
jgi:chromosome segregation ATPase